MDTLILLTFASLAINLYILWYSWSLERANCSCAITGQHTFIKYYNIASIACNCILLWFYYTHSRNYTKYEKTYLAVFLPFSVIHAWVMYKYVEQMNATNCVCSEGVERSIMSFLSLMIPVIYAFAVLLLFVGGGGVVVDYIRKLLR